MSKPSLPKELQGLLRHSSVLAPLAKAARGRKTAAPKGPSAPPQDCLPPALRDRVTLVEEENRWLAMVETSATAQLLRFHLPRLERSLAPGKSIKILVTGRRAAPAATADKLRANERPPPAGYARRCPRPAAAAHWRAACRRWRRAPPGGR